MLSQHSHWKVNLTSPTRISPGNLLILALEKVTFDKHNSFRDMFYINNTFRETLLRITMQGLLNVDKGDRSRLQKLKSVLKCMKNNTICKIIEEISLKVNSKDFCKKWWLSNHSGNKLSLDMSKPYLDQKAFQITFFIYPYVLTYICMNVCIYLSSISLEWLMWVRSKVRGKFMCHFLVGFLIV